jgi:hypothetical protein
MAEKTRGPELANFRGGSGFRREEIQFFYHLGGIGDYIYWTSTIDYIITNYTHLHGYIIAPDFFFELAQLWLGKHRDRFKIITQTEAEGNKERHDSIRAVYPQSNQVNASAIHLMEMGALYFLNKNTPKEIKRMPKIRGDEVALPPELHGLDYAVITTGATVPVRQITDKTANSLIDYLNERKLVPVFLGKKELQKNYQTNFSGGINYSGGIDLREGTTLVEAACILANAKIVAGIDGGLLHLAACSEVPLVFGATSIDPQYRVPMRGDRNKTVIIFPGEELACRFCQSNMRYTFHDFRTCIYADYLCTKMLNGPTFINAIEKLIPKEESK